MRERYLIQHLFFLLIGFFCLFLQLQNYIIINNKNIRNLILIIVFFLTFYSLFTKKTVNFFLLTLIFFVIYISFALIITNSISIDTIYFSATSFIVLIGALSVFSNIDEHVINLVYYYAKLFYFLSTCLFLYFYFVSQIYFGIARNSINYIFFWFFLISILSTAKRTLFFAIPVIFLSFLVMSRTVLFCACCIIFFKYMGSEIKFNKSLKKFISILIVFFVLFILFSFVQNKFGFNIFQKNKGISDFSSGRFDIYFECLDIISASSISNLIFGHGYSFVSTILGIGSHSDILGALIDFGIIGLFLFLCIFFFPLLQAIRYRDWVLCIQIFSIFIFFSVINNFFFSVTSSMEYALILGFLYNYKRLKLGLVKNSV